MALTDTFVKQVKPGDKPTGDKYTDSGGMYLLVKAAGKYWRMDYRFADKRKTLALGVYPIVSLAMARQRRDAARGQLASGIDPGVTKKAAKHAGLEAAGNTFEAVALEFLAAKSDDWTAELLYSISQSMDFTAGFTLVGNMAADRLLYADLYRRIKSVPSAEQAIFRLKVVNGVGQRPILKLRVDRRLG